MSHHSALIQDLGDPTRISGPPLIDHFLMTSHIRGSLIITPRIIPGGEHALQMYYVKGKPNQHTHSCIRVRVRVRVSTQPVVHGGLAGISGSLAAEATGLKPPL